MRTEATRSAPGKGGTLSRTKSSVDGEWAAKMERLRRRDRPRSRLRICDDESLRKRAEDTEKAAQRARFIAEASPDDEALARQVRDAEAESEAVRAALDDASDVLTFLALPRPVLEELLSAHPPTDAQAEEGAAFNPDTFPAALIAAASLDGMTEQEAAELLATWAAPDADLLWEAAWQVQQESRVELGKG